MQNTIGLIIIGAIILLLLIIIIHKDNRNDRLSDYVHFVEKDAATYRNAYERVCKECDELKAVINNFENKENEHEEIYNSVL